MRLVLRTLKYPLREHHGSGDYKKSGSAYDEPGRVDNCE